MKEMVKYGLILGIICLLASGVLAVVNGVTEPKIRQQKEAAQTTALKEVLPEAKSFTPRFKDDRAEYYVAYDSGSKIAGFVIPLAVKGYASTIEIATGLNRNLEITMIKVLSQNETPGLGSRVAEPEFCGQFTGKRLETFDQIQAISGATISSSAVIGTLKDTLALLKDSLLEELKNER